MADMDVDGIKMPRKVTVTQFTMTLGTKVMTVPYEVRSDDGTTITKGVTTEDLTGWPKLTGGVTLEELAQKACNIAKLAAKRKFG